MARAAEERRNSFAKWVVYSFVLLLLLVLQNTLSLRISGICLLPAAIAIISMNDSGETGVILGGIFGAMWDITTGTLFGYNALMLILIALAASFLAQYMLRVRWLSCMLVILAVTVVYELLLYFFFFVLRGSAGSFGMLMTRLLRALLSAAVSGNLLYLLLKVLCGRLIGVV